MRINHVGIIVPDLEAAKTFFTSVLGLELSARRPEPTLRAAFFRCGDIDIQLVEHPERLGTAPFGKLEHIAIDVDDMDSLLERMREAEVETQTPEPLVYGEDPPRFQTIFTKEEQGSLGVMFQLTERFPAYYA